MLTHQPPRQVGVGADSKTPSQCWNYNQPAGAVKVQTLGVLVGNILHTWFNQQLTVVWLGCVHYFWSRCLRTLESTFCKLDPVSQANILAFFNRSRVHIHGVVYKTRNLFKFLNRVIHVCTSFHNSITTKLWKMPVDCSMRPHISLKHNHNTSN